MTDELFPIPLVEQIQCVEREIALRIRVYARRVADRKMTSAQADKQIAAMSAVLDTLLWLRDNHR
jgi:predicted nucleic acid-binding protein